MDQDMGSFFLRPVIIITPTQEDLARDHRVSTRTSAETYTLVEALELGEIRINEDRRSEGTPSDSGVVLESPLTKVSRTAEDAAPKATELHPTPKW